MQNFFPIDWITGNLCAHRTLQKATKISTVAKKVMSRGDICTIFVFNDTIKISKCDYVILGRRIL